MLHKSTKIIAIIGGLFFTASVITCLVFFSIVEKEKAEYIARSTERAQAKANEASLDSLIATLAKTEEARKSLRTRIIEEEEVIDLLAQIESLGKEQRTKLTTNSLTVQPINETFETLVIQLTVEGSYGSVMQVLKLLEQLPYQSSVNKVRVALMEGEGGSLWQGAYEVRVTKFKKI